MLLILTFEVKKTFDQNDKTAPGDCIKTQAKFELKLILL